MAKVKFINLPIEEIILLEKNPRVISEEDLQKLANDIKADPAFLEQRPPLINLVSGKYYCYAGTQRVKACKLNEQTEVKCFVEENVSSKVQDERMLKDNLHRGEWDMNKLIELDFSTDDLTNIGFEDFEIMSMEDVDVNEFFQKQEDQPKEKSNKIVLEFNEEDYQNVIDKFSEMEGTKEIIILKLLGL